MENCDISAKNVSNVNITQNPEFMDFECLHIPDWTCRFVINQFFFKESCLFKMHILIFLQNFIGSIALQTCIVFFPQVLVKSNLTNECNFRKHPSALWLVQVFINATLKCSNIKRFKIEWFFLSFVSNFKIQISFILKLH